MNEFNFLKLQLELTQEEESQLRKHFTENDEDYSWDDVKIIFAIYDTRINILKTKLEQCPKVGEYTDKRISFNGC
jgi:hypothetical protein